MADYKETQNARMVLIHAKSSSESFIEALGVVRKAREAGKGPPTNAEQDLARASLVFAAAGLDSCIKHLMKESLETLADCDEKVRGGFVKFTKKVVSDESPDRLVRALLEDSPKAALLDSYIYELTGSSLQSFDEIIKAAGALGISEKDIVKSKSEITRIFKMRNQIIHELDVVFDAGAGKRQRNSRARSKLEQDSKLLIEIAEIFLDQVETKLKKSKS